MSMYGDVQISIKMNRDDLQFNEMICFKMNMS